MPFFYHVLYPIIRLIGWIVRLWGRWKVIGKENVPKAGPLVVVANHFNLVDVPLLATSLGRKAMFLAKEELFRSKLRGFIMYSFGSFPVHRGRLDRKAIRKAQQTLAKGRVLAIFPEGRRSENAQLQTALSGAVLIALRNGAPILPVAISGTEKITGVTSVLRRPRVIFNFGHPFHLPPINGKLTKEKRAELTKLVMQHIAELIPSKYRGSYTGKMSKQHEN